MDSIDWEALERDFKPYVPGTLVRYTGAMLNAHGLWVVHSEVGDERYTLRHPDNEWDRLNADREDITPVSPAAPGSQS